jgi:hypothetical protein
VSLAQRAVRLLDHGQLIGLSNEPGRAKVQRRRHDASHSEKRRVSLEVGKPNHLAVQWLTARRLPNRPITNFPAELFRPTRYSAGSSEDFSLIARPDIRRLL